MPIQISDIDLFHQEFDRQRALEVTDIQPNAVLLHREKGMIRVSVVNADHETFGYHVPWLSGKNTGGAKFSWALRECKPLFDYQPD